MQNYKQNSIGYPKFTWPIDLSFFAPWPLVLQTHDKSTILLQIQPMQNNPRRIAGRGTGSDTKDSPDGTVHAPDVSIIQVVPEGR